MNFNFIKFCAKTKMLDIMYYKTSVKAHRLIKKVEKYHTLIYYVYNIIYAKI